uniref:Uncharacterized protein n=1 Tax=Micrurus lemniscatus lemniscatus TaxID=129467 RepID=A0A2D4IR57_MICLE
MAFSLENLKAILKEYKEQAAEKNEPFGSPFEAMEREILKYEEEKKEKTIEQEAVDEKAEAILNTQKTLSVVIMRKKRQGVKNLRPDARGRKKNVLKRKQNIRKKQKGGL